MPKKTQRCRAQSLHGDQPSSPFPARDLRPLGLEPAHCNSGFAGCGPYERCSTDQLWDQQRRQHQENQTPYAPRYASQASQRPNNPFNQSPPSTPPPQPPPRPKNQTGRCLHCPSSILEAAPHHQQHTKLLQDVCRESRALEQKLSNLLEALRYFEQEQEQELGGMDWQSESTVCFIEERSVEN